MVPLISISLLLVSGTSLPFDQVAPSCASDATAMLQSNLHIGPQSETLLQPEDSFGMAGCKACPSPNNCFVKSWGDPCYQADSPADCSSNGGKWCGSLCDVCTSMNPPQTCYVKSWGSPCFSPSNGKTGCLQFSGEWCKGDSTPAPIPLPAPAPAPGPPLSCTGDAEVDAILVKANIPVLTEMANSVYTLDGFCDAIKAMSTIGKPLYAGAGSGPVKTAQALSNIASLLAQTSWETGLFKNCDETNYRGWETAACTQREDGQRYDSLTGNPSCHVDPNMHVKAETVAPWAKDNPPMECKPGTSTEGCCWWGRGAIQTTGPHNYKMLQVEVVDKVPSFKDVDLCSNPEAICQHEALKWLGGLYYWTSVVQTAAPFVTSLEHFVEYGFHSDASIVGGASFNDGTGGMVNNGAWDATAHGNEGRSKNFEKFIAGFKAAGMGEGMTTSKPPTGCALCGSMSPAKDCYVSSWSQPCFTSGSKASCSQQSGEWCGVSTTPAPVATTTQPGASTACTKCGAASCYVKSWATPCFQPGNGKAGCPSYGEWCDADAQADDACSKCGKGNCYVKGWADPCFQPWNGKDGCVSYGEYCPS